MLYTALGGIKGETFCSALQLSHRFKMLSWSYNGGFFGNYLCVGKIVASIAQGQAPALTRQGGNVRVAAPYHVEFLFQNEYASYTGRSGRTSLCSRCSVGRGFFQLQKQTCQKLWPLSALEFEARLLLPSSSSKIKMSRTVRLRRTT